MVEPTQIAIGDSVAPLPNDFPGRLVNGPIAITTKGVELSAPATMRFVLPFESEAAMLEHVAPSLLIVLAFDEATGLWNEVDARFLHGELAVETEMAQFGSFALIERGVVNNTDESAEESDDGSSVDDANDGTDANGGNGANENSADDTPPIPSDFGGGFCGGGAALVSPFMLAMIGVRRRARKTRRRKLGK
ncbi:MAG: hypothetical protein IPK83_06910 [Planctomycetes bacterium]|nr:hypothetical protein [Planctomycetota bacterium]